ncbi:MAG: UPF0280 family protein [Bacillota bacterium]
MYEPRKYRDLFSGKDLVFFNCMVKETDLQVGANRLMEGEVRSAAVKYRKQIEDYMRVNPEFLISLSPVEAKIGAPEIVKSMCAAGLAAGVGPMAAVAGAISEAVGRDMLDNWYTREIIVENGGDIFMKTDSPRKIGIYAGSSPLSQTLAVEIRPDQSPLGICTSAGTVGHSLSFGKADAAVVLAKDAALADAVATAVGDRVHSEDDLEAAVTFGSGIEGVSGVVVIVGEKVAACGDIRLVGF